MVNKCKFIENVGPRMTTSKCTLFRFYLVCACFEKKIIKMSVCVRDVSASVEGIKENVFTVLKLHQTLMICIYTLV